MLPTIFSGFLFFIALLCLGIVLIVNCRWFYHLLVEPLHIVAESGLPKELILRNYDHLIDYCSPFYQGGLSFPDFPSSDSALSHFAETKVLFSCFYLAIPICCLLGVGIVGVKVWKMQTKVTMQGIISGAGCPGEISFPKQTIAGKDDFRKYFLYEFSHSLRFAAWLCVFAPILCFLLFFTDFHKTFYGMHHIFFRNNDWIFDAATDPVITILPERYFLCCGIGIAVLLLLGAVELAVVRRLLGRLYGHEERRMNGKERRAEIPPNALSVEALNGMKD